MSVNPRVRRCVLGVRVSTDDRGQDPINQLMPLRAAVARLGWVVAEEVVLEGLSAWNAKTAAEVKRRFLSPIVEGRADTLAVWSLDRISRGGIEATLSFVREVEEHLGAAIFSLQEPWASSATQDRSTRELVVSMMAWVARQESERKSQRVRAKVEAKRNRSAAIGQSARWGRGVLATTAQTNQVLALRGSPVRAIAQVVGISKSAVSRILAAPPSAPKEVSA